MSDFEAQCDCELDSPGVLSHLPVGERLKHWTDWALYLKRRIETHYRPGIAALEAELERQKQTTVWTLDRAEQAEAEVKELRAEVKELRKAMRTLGGDYNALSEKYTEGVYRVWPADREPGLTFAAWGAQLEADLAAALEENQRLEDDHLKAWAEVKQAWEKCREHEAEVAIRDRMLDIACRSGINAVASNEATRQAMIQEVVDERLADLRARAEKEESDE